MASTKDTYAMMLGKKLHASLSIYDVTTSLTDGGPDQNRTDVRRFAICWITILPLDHTSTSKVLLIHSHFGTFNNNRGTTLVLVEVLLTSI